MYNSVDIMTAIAHELSGEKVLVATSVGVGQLTVEELGNLKEAGAIFLVSVPEGAKGKPVITVESVEEAPLPSGGGRNVQR